MRAVLYYNDETLVSEAFGEESIKRSSKFIYTNINEEKPSYFSFDFQTSHIEDMINLVQIGNNDEIYFQSPK